jgi:hypothetical protein
MFTAGEIFDILIRNGQIRFPESTDNPAERIIKFDRALFRIQTVVGPRDVSGLKVSFRLSAETISSPLPAKGFSYQGAVRPTVHGLETQTKVLGNHILVSIHQEPGSNMFAVTVTKKDKQ